MQWLEKLLNWSFVSEIAPETMRLQSFIAIGLVLLLTGPAGAQQF
jgi:hypothetical protein